MIVVGGLDLPLHFIIFFVIIIVIIITVIVNISFITFIITRILERKSLLLLRGKLTVWFCFLQFLYVS